MIRTDSLGEIIDKLITNSIKQYMQEITRNSSKDEKERLSASDAIISLNCKRWKLINAINELADNEIKEPEFKSYAQKAKI